MSRPHTHRGTRTRRRATPPLSLETLEGRTLLSLTLIKDINQAPASPAEITAVGSKVFFTTRAADGGTNLVVQSASGTQVLKDFNAAPGGGSYGNAVSQLTAAGSKLFFVATGSAATGAELWVSDGTVGGTQIVKDLTPGAGGTYLSDLTAVGPRLYFTAYNVPGVVGLGGSPLFETDGTAAGTFAIAPPPGGPTGGGSTIAAGASALADDNGKLVFMSGDQLETNDGTATGTTVIHTFTKPSGSTASQPANFAVVGVTLYVTAVDDAGKPALFKSDGTDSGTAVVKDFSPGASPNPYFHPPTLGTLTAAGANLFFTANDATNGPALWATDGTAAGTKLLKSLPKPANAYVTQLIGGATVAGSKLFFTTNPTPTTTALWASNGTAAGTVKVADLNAPTPSYMSSSQGSPFGALNGSLYFANYGPVKGLELWKSDGTAAGTGLFKDINPGAASSFPSQFATAGGRLYFSATDGTGGNQLWRSDGTPGGTVMLKAFTPAVTSNAVYGGSSDEAVLGTTMLFSANDGVHGRELWKTDGTTAGTVMLKDLLPGPGSSSPFNFASAGGKVFFATSSGGSSGQIWVTNGTAPGTIPLKTVGGSISYVEAYKTGVVFIVHDSSSSSSLWVSNGTAAGTVKLKSFKTLGYGAPTLYNGKLYFAASDGTHGTQPWMTDGTAAGTKMLVQISPSSTSGSNPSSFKVFNKKLYFAASDGKPGAELWASDGTAAGTKVVVNLGTKAASLSNITVAGATLYFFTPVANAEYETMNLWKTNGTAAGTVQIFSGAGHYIPYPQPVGLPNGTIFFQVGTLPSGSSGSQFQNWISNGTAAGTKVLKSNVNGSFSYTPAKLINGKLYFSGGDAIHGQELWVTDGTTLGTALVADVNPGKGSSYAGAVGLLNGNIIVVANDGIHGDELFTTGRPR